MNEADLRITTFRHAIPGHEPTAVRVCHLPTGYVETSFDHPSYDGNRRLALQKMEQRIRTGKRPGFMS